MKAAMAADVARYAELAGPQLAALIAHDAMRLAEVQARLSAMRKAQRYQRKLQKGNSDGR